MKRLIAVLVLLGCVFAFTACMPLQIISGVVSGVYVALNPDYAAPDESFSCGKLSITLTSEFRAVLRSDYSLEIQSTSGNQVHIDEYDYIYSNFAPENTLEEQAEVLRQEIIKASEEDLESVIVNVTEVKSEDGIVCFTYDIAPVITIRYFVSFYMDDENVWVVYFACPSLAYDTYLPYFKKWAGSVVIDDSDSAI